ncbi:hypothetical protein CXB51_023490 [Gossypium anomalum]|uniref:Uncharacterized protein n=1 Tax=Gossypium anomalum TaxID=47600 RepID=A0A8J5YKX6_9ROSI|nr:hypothetical protein CXB51_023490 [Gossypium anomalum]
MPSLPLRSILLPLIPSLTPFHAGLSSHRLKHLEKSDRREVLRSCIDFTYRSFLKKVEMDILGSGEVENLSDIKHAMVRTCFNDVNESNDTNTSKVEGLLEQRQKSKPPSKCLAKSASFPSAVSTPDDDDDEIVTAMQRMFSEDSVQSPLTYSRSISLPTPLKLVSALKGSREKQGLPPKKLTVKWAPDVYDPPPTSLLHTVRSKKQQKSKKKNDKKKNGKKGQKGNNSGRGCGGGKDNKQIRRGGGSSDRCYKPPPEVHQDRLANSSVSLEGFNVGSPDPYCGSSFLKKSPTRMHYSVAEAL